MLHNVYLVYFFILLHNVIVDMMKATLREQHFSNDYHKQNEYKSHKRICMHIGIRVEIAMRAS